MAQPWIYNGKEFEGENISEYVGFVYEIENLTNGKKYIGKKLFRFKKTRQVKKKKKKFQVESDWKSYFGSNEELLKDVAELGESSFKRIILYLCRTKGECNYFEAYSQFTKNVLTDPNYYNQWIIVKIHKSHIKHLNQP
jgi:hypothetical protein